MDKRFTCVIDYDVYRKLKIYAAEKNIKIKDLVAEAIKEKIEK